MDWMFLLKGFATLLAFLGAIAVVLGLPGTFVAWLGLFIYAIVSRFAIISGWALLGTLVGCIFVELADNLLSGLMVKKFGASKASMVIAWIGGFLGAILGSAIGGVSGFIGSAILGVVGAFIGSYAGVYLWERHRLNRPHNEAAKAAFGTVLGRLLGIFVKLCWIAWLLILVW